MTGSASGIRGGYAFVALIAPKRLQHLNYARLKAFARNMLKDTLIKLAESYDANTVAHRTVYRRGNLRGISSSATTRRDIFANS